MLESILFFLWMGAMVIVCVPPVGRWVYVRMLSIKDGLETFINDNLFS